MKKLTILLSILLISYITIGCQNIDRYKIETINTIDSKEVGLKSDSVVLAEQIRTIDKSRLKEKIGHIEDQGIMEQINNAIGISFGL